MPLDILTRKEIAERMILRMLGRNINVTDLTPISNARIIMESFADEFASLHASIAKAQNSFFINTATGADLDRRLLDYGLTRPSGDPASGVVTVIVSEDSVVPAGATFRNSAGVSYVVQGSSDRDDGAWIFGSGYPLVRNIDVICTQDGIIGNTGSNTITISSTPIENLVSIGNPNPFSNGKDTYNDDEFRKYFRDYLVGLRGGTRGAIISGILRFSQTTPGGARRIPRQVALEESDGITPLDGESSPISLRIYISEGGAVSDSPILLANNSLVAAVQRYVDGTDGTPGLKSAGVVCRVLAAGAVPISVYLKISTDPTFNYALVESEIRARLANFFYQMPIAGINANGERDGNLNYAKLFNMINDIPGVLIADFDFPRSDIRIPVGKKAVLGNLLISRR